MRGSREWHTWTRFDSRRRWWRRSRRAHERLGGSFFTPCQFLLLVGEARRVVRSGTRIFKVLGAVVVVVAALALMGPAAWSTDALAQGASPPASQPQSQAPEGATVEGKIAKVSGAKVTLAHGTELMIPSGVKVQRAHLKPGATVKASFEVR